MLPVAKKYWDEVIMVLEAEVSESLEFDIPFLEMALMMLCMVSDLLRFFWKLIDRQPQNKFISFN